MKNVEDHMVYRTVKENPISEEKEKEIIAYLRTNGYVRKVYPWKKNDNRPEMLALLMSTESKGIDSCLDQIRLWFKITMTQTELLNLLERNKIVYFKSDEDFQKKKQPYEDKLKLMNDFEDAERIYKKSSKNAA